MRDERQRSWSGRYWFNVFARLHDLRSLTQLHGRILGVFADGSTVLDAMKISAVLCQLLHRSHRGNVRVVDFQTNRPCCTFLDPLIRPISRCLREWFRHCNSTRIHTSVTAEQQDSTVV